MPFVVVRGRRCFASPSRRGSRFRPSRGRITPPPYSLVPPAIAPPPARHPAVTGSRPDGHRKILGLLPLTALQFHGQRPVERVRSLPVVQQKEKRSCSRVVARSDSAASLATALVPVPGFGGVGGSGTLSSSTETSTSDCSMESTPLTRRLQRTHANHPDIARSLKHVPMTALQRMSRLAVCLWSVSALQLAQ